MNLRQIKRRTQRMIDHFHTWELMTEKVGFIRNATKCKSYHPCCIDCNTHLFIRTHKRFPYYDDELHEFHRAIEKQSKHPTPQ